MATSETLLNLKVNKMTNEAYNAKVAEGSIDSTALYLTPEPTLEGTNNISVKEDAANNKIIFSVADGNTNTAGIVKLSDATNGTANADTGKTAATPAAVAAAYKKASHTHPYLPNTTVYAGGETQGGAATSANKVNASVTFNTTGGAGAGTAFDGSSAVTVDYSTVGAAPEHDHPYLLDDTKYAGSSSQGGAANSVKEALTFSTTGNGATSGSYNGSTAKTISYNTVGAASASHTHTKSEITDFSHTHNYAGSDSPGGAANSVAKSLTITLNSGNTEGTNKFTYNGSTAKTINITSPGVNRGIEKSGNDFVLNQAFYDYLLKQTFATPTISSFSLSGTNTSGSKEVGTAVSVTGITHAETNTDNIKGTLTLSRGAGAGEGAKTLSTTIAKSSSSTSVTVSDSFTASTSGTVTYTLSALYEDTTGASNTATKTASISFYWPSFIFASSNPTPNVSGQTKRSSQGVTGTHTVTTTSTNAHVHFVTANTISSIKSGGFDVPYTESTLSVTINGCAKTYNTYSILNCEAGSNTFVVS